MSPEAETALAFIRAHIATGLVERAKNAILLLDESREPFAFINRHKVLGSVTRQPDGRLWYSYASTRLEDQFQLSGLRYLEQCEIVATLSCELLLS